VTQSSQLLISNNLSAGGVRMTACALEFEHGPDLQDLLERCNDYSQTAFGIDTAPADGQSQYLAGTDVVTEDCKQLIGIYESNVMVAAVDCLLGYPDDNAVSLQLLVVDPKYRSKGIGSALLASLEAECRLRGFSMLIVHCHVSNNKRAWPFWARHGFQEQRRVRLQIVPSVERERVLLYRKL
jgi:GNAT superfamily N-acetyltransferase